MQIKNEKKRETPIVRPRMFGGKVMWSFGVYIVVLGVYVMVLYIMVCEYVCVDIRRITCVCVCVCVDTPRLR